MISWGRMSNETPDGLQNPWGNSAYPAQMVWPPQNRSVPPPHLATAYGRPPWQQPQPGMPNMGPPQNAQNFMYHPAQQPPQQWQQLPPQRMQQPPHLTQRIEYGTVRHAPPPQPLLAQQPVWNGSGPSGMGVGPSGGMQYDTGVREQVAPQHSRQNNSSRGGYNKHHQNQQMHQQAQQQSMQWQPQQKMEPASWDNVSVSSKEYGQWSVGNHQQQETFQPQPQPQQWSNEWAASQQQQVRPDMNYPMMVPGQQQQQQQQQRMQQQPSVSMSNWQSIAPEAAARPDDTENWEPPGASAVGGSGSGGGGGGNLDMYWHDPNPKNKRIVRDSGTAVWGDPQTQTTEIRRWKEADHEEFQKGPASATWNQPLGNGPGWVDTNEANLRPHIWESEDQNMPPNFVDENYRLQTDQMSQSLLEQIQRAISKGYLKPNILSQKLSPDKIKLVNSLLQRSYRLEQAESELEHHRRNIGRDHSLGMITVSKQEYDRLVQEVEQLKMDMNMISVDLQPSKPTSSRLQQWQRGKSTSGPENGVDQLAGSLQGIGISDDKTVWSTADGSGLDWTKPVGNNPLANNDSLTKPLSIVAGNPLTGPPEFIPGQRWEWTDPKEVGLYLAEDPDATPASIRPPFASPKIDDWNSGWNNHTRNGEKEASTSK